jgi:N-acetylmuramoyl-L-alanine amidase
VATRNRDSLRSAAVAALGLTLALAAAAPPAAAQRAQATPRRLVVVDAGHGGVDPGARGPRGMREKDVTLAVARRLAAILAEDPRLEVRMTRDADTLIALRDRPRMANAWRSSGGADRPALFISIHANAHRQASAHGYETYFLSEAKTADARRVAEMENAAEQYEDRGEKPSDDLSFIFQDLRQNLYLRESSDWAKMIQHQLGEVHPGPDRGVKQAGFVVLNGAFMPAVLVELGFITNPEEERLLAHPGRQAELAGQLADAIHAYFERHQLASGS